MKWIGNLFLASLLTTSSLSAEDSLLEESGRNAKIELIRCELYYANYLLFLMNKNDLSKDMGIPWISEIIMTAVYQLDELEDDQ